MRNCAGQSTASGNDTMCIPVDTLKKIYTAAASAKELRVQISILNERIETKKAELMEIKNRDSAEIVTLRGNISRLLEEKALYDDQLNGYERLLRKEKRKRFWTAAGGLITTGLVAYLYLTK